MNKDVRKNFPIFGHHPDLVYLDNAASAQKPQVVIDKVSEFYERFNANVHRGIYDLSEKSSELYELARKTLAEFINANSTKEIIFTSGTTDSINKLASSLCENLTENDTILVTKLDHHSNILPWQQVCKKRNANLEYIELTSDYLIDLENLKELLDENRVRIISLPHTSNVTGSVANLKQIVKLARNYSNVLIHVDAAQSVAHKKIDVQELGIDFMSFSGHKMYGPTGIGILWGRQQLLGELEPFGFGGGMIEMVNLKSSTWANLPERHEAGTPNIAGAVGLKQTVEYLKELDFESIQAQERELLEYAINELSKIDQVQIFTPRKMEDKSSVISFTVAGVHAHDVAQILADLSVAVRAGHHCAQILHRDVLRVPATLRASIGMYNTRQDIDSLVGGIQKAISDFN